MNNTKEYPFYIKNRSSDLRVKSSKDKMASIKSRSKNRRAKSSQSVRRTVRSKRSVLDNFNPSNFKEIQMHYGEKPNSQDCVKLTEDLKNELNEAKNMIESKNVEIMELDKKLKMCKMKKASDLGDEVGKRVTEMLSKRVMKSLNDVTKSSGGKRHRKSTTKKYKKNCK